MAGLRLDEDIEEIEFMRPSLPSTRQTLAARDVEAAEGAGKGKQMERSMVPRKKLKGFAVAPLRCLFRLSAALAHVQDGASPRHLRQLEKEQSAIALPWKHPEEQFGADANLGDADGVDPALSLFQRATLVLGRATDSGAAEVDDAMCAERHGNQTDRGSAGAGRHDTAAAQALGAGRGGGVGAAAANRARG